MQGGIKTMLYSDMLVIPDGSPEIFFGVLAIITTVILIYAFAFSELMRKKTAKLKEAKRLAVEGLNVRKLYNQEEEDEEYED